jgi:hypothetical protein
VDIFWTAHLSRVSEVLGDRSGSVFFLDPTRDLIDVVTVRRVGTCSLWLCASIASEHRLIG